MPKTSSSIVGALLIVLVGGFVYIQTSSAKTAATNTTPTPVTDTGKSIMLAEIAQHNDKTSCWSTINGGVYDLTSWVSRHPGGEQAILSICGIDGSAAFNAQHGGARQQQQILATFKIGTLAQ